MSIKGKRSSAYSLKANRRANHLVFSRSHSVFVFSIPKIPQWFWKTVVWRGTRRWNAKPLCFLWKALEHLSSCIPVPGAAEEVQTGNLRWSDSGKLVCPVGGVATSEV